MKTATHTPGPWASHGRSIFCEKGKMIGAAHLRRGEKIDVSFANARMFSAAPDLLEAAKAALRFIQNAEHDAGRDFSEGNLLRLSIDKAEGRE